MTESREDPRDLLDDRIETSLHLISPPLYSRQGIPWNERFENVADRPCGSLTWDAAAALSIVSFNYACGDRTLFEELTRTPWLSRPRPNGGIVLESIPPHGRMWVEPGRAADTLSGLLFEEIQRACEGKSEIYVLLSGGLDSRIVACLVAKLYGERYIPNRPIAVTWGLQDSRDVHYGRATAGMLGLDWVHLPIGPESILESLNEGVVPLGGLVAPTELHRMLWFKEAPRDALVLAGSYGDSVGRAEFSGRHLMELALLQPRNTYGLIRREILSDARTRLLGDLHLLHGRSPGAPRYVLCEHEMQAHYMRGMIGHAMMIINRFCALYQVFTNPSVYTYMWSLHPACRNDRVYGALLEVLDERLARLPWARTNRALSGRTAGAKRGLRRQFQRYAEWISGPLYPHLAEAVDPDWFAETGVFDPRAIRDLSALVAQGQPIMKAHGYRPFELWVWLAAVRLLGEHLTSRGIDLVAPCPEGEYHHDSLLSGPMAPQARLAASLSRIPFARRVGKKLHRGLLKRQFIKEYPPVYGREFTTC